MTSFHPAALDSARWQRLDNELIDDPCESIPRQVGASSRGRPWRGLAVWLQQGPREDLYIPPTRKHCIVIRRAPTAQLLQRQGSEVRERAWGPGEAVIVPAGTPSFWRSDSARDNLHIDLDPAWLARAIGDERDTPPALRPCFGADDPLLRHFGELLLGALDSNVSLNPAFADSIATALALHLLENHVQADALPRRTGALTRRQFDRVTEALEAELAEDWPLERMATLLQLSPFHFARAFKAACGETPHRHLLRRRLERSREQVLESNLPLIDIAVDTGFASLSHFGQAFRRQWGVSPSQMRRGG